MVVVVVVNCILKMQTVLRRCFATAHVRAPEGPASYIVEALTKSPGEPVSFGETLALLRSNQEQVILTSPVHGQVVNVTYKIGDLVSPDAEIAALEGRKPSIAFRHLKGSAANQKNPSARIISQSGFSQAPSPSTAQKKSGSSNAKTILDVPPHFGRLPPLTEKEEALLLSGGAYDA